MFELTASDKKWVDETWDKLDKKLSLVSRLSYDKIPYTTVNGVHDDAKTCIYRWTNGFWPGLMWLMYVGTKNEQYRKTAEHSEVLLDDALKLPEKLNHDVGFMWHISSGINYRLFGGEESMRRTFFVANMLAGRFNCRGNFIRAWNGAEKEGQVIIDCMMNLPLLYWASEQTGDVRYRHIAEAHADNTIKTHIRDDGSVRHIVSLDPETGDIREFIGGQGFGPESSWSRGQAWAIYGFILSYIHTKKQSYLDVAKRVAHYFIANVQDDYIPRVDFRAPGLEHDTTAGAIAACGLLEIANYVDEYEKKLYFDAALKILKALDKRYCDWSEKEQSVLQHGVEKYFPEEIRQGHSIIYGDYYFTEAIYKLRGFEKLFW